MKKAVYRLLALALALALSNGVSPAGEVLLPADLAPSWGWGPFVRPNGVNPLIKPDPNATFDCPMAGKPIHWEATHTFNPSAVVKDGKVYILYRAEDDSGTHIGGYTSRIGMAVSDDGLHFTTSPTPVLYPDNDAQKAMEWRGGCEDPRLIEGPEGTYVILYTQWNRKNVTLAAATSKDLVHWEKHGGIFAKALDGRYAALRGGKSGAIVGKLEDGRVRAAKINGKYWLYWGEGDIQVATSDNLIDWTMVETSPGQPLKLLPRRPHHFDSRLAEAGPNAIVTDKGIVFIYNGKNQKGAGGDMNLPEGIYCVGEALFDSADPTKLLQRTEKPIFQPEAPYEQSGQYVGGTTFVEGLVYFRQKWLLYYGCADSLVAMAVYDPSATATASPVAAAPATSGK
ncbi:MAG TPA: glycoside hydrolase family 130 protein [Candidatus Methylacidiphilales bacterium]